MKTPLGVKIIAILQIINAIRLLLASILLFIGVYGAPYFGLGLIVLVSSLIFGFLGFNLLKLKSWARTASIIILVFTTLLSIFKSEIIIFIFSLVSSIYLCFSEKVKKSFK